MIIYSATKKSTLSEQQDTFPVQQAQDSIYKRILRIQIGNRFVIQQTALLCSFVLAAL